MVLFSWHRAKVFFQPELEVIIQQNPQKQWKHHRFVHFWDEIVASVGFLPLKILVSWAMLLNATAE